MGEGNLLSSKFWRSGLSVLKNVPHHYCFNCYCAGGWIFLKLPWNILTCWHFGGEWEFSFPLGFDQCLKGESLKYRSEGHDKASHHLTMRAQQAVFHSELSLLSVSSFEAPIKQNRLINYEGVSEVGSYTYSNRFSFSDVCPPEKRTVRRWMRPYQWLLMASLLEWVWSVSVWGMWAFCSRSNSKLVHEVNVLVKRQDGLVTIISFNKFAYKDKDWLSGVPFLNSQGQFFMTLLTRTQTCLSCAILLTGTNNSSGLWTSSSHPWILFFHGAFPANLAPFLNLQHPHFNELREMPRYIRDGFNPRNLSQ